MCTASTHTALHLFIQQIITEHQEKLRIVDQEGVWPASYSGPREDKERRVPPQWGSPSFLLQVDSTAPQYSRSNSRLTFQPLGWPDRNSGEQSSLNFCLALEQLLTVGSKATLISLLFIGTTNLHLEEYGKVAKSYAILLGLEYGSAVF